MTRWLLLGFWIVSTGSCLADLPEIKKRGYIKFCYFARFNVDTVPDHRGPDYDLAEAFAKAIGLKAVGKRVKWEEFYENEQGQVVKEATYTPRLLARGDCDFFATSMTVIDWRLTKMDIPAIHSARIMVMVRQESGDSIRSVADLGGKQTVVTRETTLHALMLELNSTVLKTNPIKIRTGSLGGTTHELLAGNVDFIFMDTSQGLQFLKENPGKVKLTFPVGPNQALGWGFAKYDPLLQRAFQRFVERERSQPQSEMNAIFRKYYGVSVDEFQSVVHFSQTQE